MPEHIVTVTYTKELVAATAWVYWKRTVGVRGFILFAVLPVALVALFALGIHDWVLSFVCGATMVYSAIVVAAYVRMRSMAMDRFNNLNAKTATFRFTEEGLAAESDAGKTEIAWRLIEKVIQTPDAWLISIAKSNYFTLPIVSVPPETRAFILDHVHNK